MSKATVALAAVAALALAAAVSASASAAGIQGWSPHKVAGMLQAKQFKVGAVKRKGSTYVVLATGKKGNQVRFVVDGRNGKVLGMDVVKWAPGAKRVKRGSHGADIFDEFYEFGVTIPAATYVTWVDYEPAQWTVETTDYIEVTYEEVSYETVTYEESVEEVTEEYAETGTVETTETTETTETVETTEVSETTVEDHAEPDDHDEPGDTSDPDDDDEPH